MYLAARVNPLLLVNYIYCNISMLAVIVQQPLTPCLRFLSWYRKPMSKGHFYLFIYSSDPMAASSSSSPALSDPTFPSALSIKLERSHYPVWLAQMVPLLRSCNLFKFVDGTSLPPLEFLPHEPNTDSSADKNDLISNPLYELWIQQDQQVLSPLPLLFLLLRSTPWLVRHGSSLSVVLPPPLSLASSSCAKN